MPAMTHPDDPTGASKSKSANEKARRLEDESRAGFVLIPQAQGLSIFKERPLEQADWLLGSEPPPEE